MNTGAGVGVAVAVIGIWWLSTHGKGTAPGRLVAWLVAIIVVWGMVSLKDPAAAGNVAGSTAAGVSTLITGLGTFLGDVFR